MAHRRPDRPGQHRPPPERRRIQLHRRHRRHLGGQGRPAAPRRPGRVDRRPGPGAPGGHDPARAGRVARPGPGPRGLPGARCPADPGTGMDPATRGELEGRAARPAGPDLAVVEALAEGMSVLHETPVPPGLADPRASRCSTRCGSTRTTGGWPRTGPSTRTPSPPSSRTALSFPLAYGRPAGARRLHAEERPGHRRAAGAAGLGGHPRRGPGVRPRHAERAPAPQGVPDPRAVAGGPGPGPGVPRPGRPRAGRAARGRDHAGPAVGQVPGGVPDRRAGPGGRGRRRGAGPARRLRLADRTPSTR